MKIKLVRGACRIAVMVVSERGGVRKSTVSLGVFEDLLSRGIDTTLIQVDEQNRLKALHPDRVETINMPTTEMIRGNDLADAEALAKLYDRLSEMHFGSAVIIDLGANYDRRYFDWAASVRLAQACEAAGVTVLCIVPSNADDDAISLAARTARRFQAAFPTGSLMPIWNLDGVDPSTIPASAATEQYEAAFNVAPGSLDIVRHHRLFPGALAAVERSGLSPAGFAQARPIDLVAALQRPVSVVRQVHSDVVVFMDNQRKEWDRIFDVTAP